MIALTVARREFSMGWRNPLCWTLVGLFSLLSGWMFFNLLAGWVDSVQSLPPEAAATVGFFEEVVLRLYSNLHFLLLFFIPPMTMKLVAEERRQGTIDLLWSSPASDTEIILGKFIGAWLSVVCLFLPTLLYPLILLWAGIPDIAVVGSCYLGLVLTAGCYVALGLFASCLTQNQVVAALLAFVFIMSSWMAAWVSQIVGNFWFSEVVHYVSVTAHFEAFVRGAPASSDVVYFVSLMGLALLAAVKALNSRNW
jgi:ABC-2 type transport system permease protein